MVTRITRKERDFTVLDNEALRNTNLSFEARGLLAYLLTHTTGWQVRCDVILKNNKIKKCRLQRLFKELETEGYACLVSIKDPITGKFKGKCWDITEEPIHRGPEKPTVGESGCDKKDQHLRNTNNNLKIRNEGEGIPGIPDSPIPSLYKKDLSSSLYTPDLADLSNLLNNQPSPFDYSQLVDRLNEARVWVKENVSNEIEPGNYLPAQTLQLQALDSPNILKRPVYHKAERSDRLYISGWSLQNLKSGVRQILLRGHLQLDLEYAQLAILAKIWDEPGILEFCKPGMWAELAQSAGLDISHKPILKKTLYAACYGSKWTTRRNALMVDLDIDQTRADKIMRVRLFEKLFKASQRAFQTAKNAGFVTDAFGQKLTWDNEEGLRSVMASVAQSYELRLLAPAIQYLHQQEIPIILWLHDGFYIPGETHSHHTTQMKKLVDQKAHELGFATSLEITPV